MRDTPPRLTQLWPLAAGQVVGLACGIIGVRWMSAVVPPDLLGVYGVWLSLVLAALSVTHQGLVKQVQQHWTGRAGGRAWVAALLRAAWRPALWLGAGLGVVLAGLHHFTGLEISATTWLWLTVVNLLIAAAGVGQAALQAETRYGANLGATSLGSVTRSFLPPLLVTIGAASLGTLLTGFFLHALLTATVAFWLLRAAWNRVDATAPDAEELRRVTLTFAHAGWCGWLASAVPRWAAAGVLSAEETGYFVLAGNLAIVIPAALGAIALGWSFPRVFGAARDGAPRAALRRETERMLAAVMLLGQMGVVVLWAVAPWLVGPVIDPRYADALTWLLPTGGAALAATSAQFYQNQLLAERRDRECLGLALWSSGWRIVALVGAAVVSRDAFWWTLVLLPWTTLALEAALVRRRSAGNP